MTDTAQVLVTLVVFDRGPKADGVLSSFAKMAAADILETWESSGYADKVAVPGLGTLPAHRGVKWADMSAEEAIDNWLEEQEPGPDFAVILAYSQAPNPDMPLLAWSRVQGHPPHTVGDFLASELSSALGVKGNDLWCHQDLAGAVVARLINHPEMAPLHASAMKFQAHEQAQEMEETTPSAPQPRQGPRL